MIKFLHTADLQIGKSFHFVEDNDKRRRLIDKRIDCLTSIRNLIESENHQFAVICGDIFDSFTPTKSTVSEFCAAIGSWKIPVYAIPGNHDYAGPGCVWDQDFFNREKTSLAPNFHLLRTTEPLIEDQYIILPCPLNQRHESQDPSLWLRSYDYSTLPNLPKVIIAHGSVHGFSSCGEEEVDESIFNYLKLDALPTKAYDYIALGDWHGTKEISEKIWYSGTPEQDRFAKGENNQPGNILTVEINTMTSSPKVNATPTGLVKWHDISRHFDDNYSIQDLGAELDGLLQQQAGQDLLKLQLTGCLKLSEIAELEKLIETLNARLLHLRLDNQSILEPSIDELQALTQRDDPIISGLATELSQKIQSSHSTPEELVQAKQMLRTLYLQIAQIQ